MPRQDIDQLFAELSEEFKRENAASANAYQPGNTRRQPQTDKDSEDMFDDDFDDGFEHAADDGFDDGFDDDFADDVSTPGTDRSETFYDIMQTRATLPADYDEPETDSVLSEDNVDEALSEPSGEKEKTDIVSKVILIVSLIVFVCSAGFLVYKYFGEPLIEQISLAAFKMDYTATETPSADNGKWEDDQETEEEQEQEPRLENGILASFQPLLQRNGDVVGWISVPNTPIDYPVVQTDNNSFYLTHNINREYNSSGCPFLDYRDVVEKDQLSKCSLIYGHHRRNGTMFAKLTNYNKLDFYKQNPVLRFDTIYNRAQWVIFANIRVTASTETGVPFNYLRTEFESDEDYLSFIQAIRKRSLIDTPVEVTADDDILLLSTCSYEKTNWRMVIAARKLRPGETSIDVSDASMAADPLMP